MHTVVVSVHCAKYNGVDKTHSVIVLFPCAKHYEVATVSDVSVCHLVHVVMPGGAKYCKTDTFVVCVQCAKNFEARPPDFKFAEASRVHCQS